MNNDYMDRIQAVLHFIEDNLDQEMNLEMLAEISNFSKYHFSRVFSAVINKTPITYLTERRLLHAVTYLKTTNKTMLEISSLCGFSSISSFNSSFKKLFKTTPSGMRRSMQEHSNNQLMSGNIQEELSPSKNYYGSINNNNNFLRRVWEMNIEVKELPSYKVAFVRYFGSYLETYKAWGTLGTWAEKNNLFPPTQYFIGISLDDPNVTDEYSCRYDACVTLPNEFSIEGDSSIEFKTLPGGFYALYKFYDTIDKFAIAYQCVYGQWLPNSDYEPDDRHALEFCMNNPSTDPEGKAKVDLYIPIKRIVGH